MQVSKMQLTKVCYVQGTIEPTDEFNELISQR